ncbi:hypothetical protein DPMN_191243 [Dreissena polymorpha]|uniref:Uncharacterized protein n=1 Tax=Dreissena polymorpha TaxID=45954 RepID=A0A9D3Y261_DREPO|nr:hypothetical protein DPMN_191243 [Dreissena polymorpha]
MSSCADVVMELLSTKNGAVCAVSWETKRFSDVCWQFKSGSWSEQSCFLELQQYARSRDVMLTGVEHRAECLSSDDMTVGVNSGAKQSCFWSYSTSLEVEQNRRGCESSHICRMLMAVMGFQADLNRKALIWISTAETQFIKSKIRVTGLHMEEDFHVCYSTLQKQVDVQMASSTDVFLGAAKQELWCTCSQRRRRFKKRNIAEKVNGTCKQDFTCRNGLIAVPTVNKDFSCCETTQQKIQVPGVDREMCLKKEFYYCDSTLQKQGLSCSDAKEEDFKKESLLQLRPITRKEIQQLCLDSSHETYIAVTVPHMAVYGCVACCMAVVSNVARARLWTEEDCPQRDWIQNTNFTAGRVFSTTRRVRFTTRRAVTTRRLCGNNTTKNCTARRAVTERRLNMQHKTKHANIQTLMWTPSSQYIRVAYSCDKTVGPSHR